MSNESWLTSSFDNDDFHIESEKPTVNRKRKLQQKSTCDRNKLFQKGTFVKNEIKSWVEKYAPTSKDTLAVNKKKVAQVEEWLKNYFDQILNKNISPILLLTGPAGAGKTATMKVLAKEMQLDLVEWSHIPHSSSQTLLDFGIVNISDNILNLVIKKTMN
ncbi:cell cycle checkpoint protein RAD17-like [Centruroides sculpturatus]|uniref:cell cycle checkpoint protein RAD17-like n=1 Tax=Centruroides sculpturatus TaxID=218467 RepID=UPI000C6E68F8|nr:cell cycle checkpoint protein RAD17-like [Centruroides sculpturatus]